ncbi:uncharacterized protein LOC131425120 [Malaya genurostris]|uniref:uncharacterized protein LOC131425120 n=1 Tax=Malaya genurostris TaxID=325434 RepID=UPI0026F3CA40|nr:uncharacterized protein LOC131425120 [Malaya genurostris]
MEISETSSSATFDSRINFDGTSSDEDFFEVSPNHSESRDISETESVTSCSSKIIYTDQELDDSGCFSISAQKSMRVNNSQIQCMVNQENFIDILEMDGFSTSDPVFSNNFEYWDRMLSSNRYLKEVKESNVHRNIMEVDTKENRDRMEPYPCVDQNKRGMDGKSSHVAKSVYNRNNAMKSQISEYLHKVVENFKPVEMIPDITTGEALDVFNVTIPKADNNSYDQNVESIMDGPHEPNSSQTQCTGTSGIITENSTRQSNNQITECFFEQQILDFGIHSLTDSNNVLSRREFPLKDNFHSNINKEFPIDNKCSIVQSSCSNLGTSKISSVLPSLEVEYSLNLEDIPQRQRELISAITQIFQRLSQLEIEGNQLFLQVKSRATWELCSVQNEILTRCSTPIDSIKTIRYNCKNGQHRFQLILFLLSEIFKLLATQSSCTKRELYYRDTQLTHNQRTVDEGLRDVCFLLKADLWELNVFSSSKGLVAGPLKFRSKHDEMIDCFNSLGTLVPTDVNGLVEIIVDADLLLIVEKDTVFRRLLDDGVLERLSKKIIIITSKGYPDVGTRLLLNKIWNKYHTPMYALVDADPYGIEIYCVYKFGSLVCYE